MSCLVFVLDVTASFKFAAEKHFQLHQDGLRLIQRQASGVQFDQDREALAKLVLNRMLKLKLQNVKIFKVESLALSTELLICQLPCK